MFICHKKKKKSIQELDNVLIGLPMATAVPCYLPVQGSATFTIKGAILPHVLSNKIPLGIGGH